jgi:hypothetical protein
MGRLRAPFVFWRSAMESSHAAGRVRKLPNDGRNQSAIQDSFDCNRALVDGFHPIIAAAGEGQRKAGHRLSIEEFIVIAVL